MDRSLDRPENTYQLAWAAGIIDGEGCISLYRVRTHTGQSWVIRVAVGVTSPVMVENLMKIFGLGTIYTNRSKTKKHKAEFRWEVCSKKAEQVLEKVLPYLVVKRQQAEVALASRRLMQRHGHNKKNPNDAEIAWLKKQLHGLNQKGPGEVA